ncbi:MAG: 50S ribosomal protein L18 [Rhodospirillaceae bacterium]|nr:50S ribosomal protein L18 [Rhodospirillaceae bacterium]MCY4237860.1 50S ribosomal protein L18 [Rhodospirillaceae bacterium]MCY4310119.1 50S ribosomal protein L18 [Rhodospirillaceae bacterium]
MAGKEKKLFARRQRRNRYAIRKRANGKPRLSVFRSERHIYAQVIDDLTGKTKASASTVEEGFKSTVKSGANIEAAQTIGKLVAERALKAKVETVVFDRGGYVYHGRVKALADAAREAGLKF